MGDISPGYLFVPSEGRDRLTSVKLNAAGNGAKINPSFVASKPAVSSVTSADQLLLLKADGSYARVPATAVGTGGGGGGGDMYKSVYDTNGNGVVDTADAIAWTAVTGKPATFPPDSTAMLKSVYDVNSDNIVDHAALADTAPWAGITGKPATFPPDSSAMLKVTYDPNSDGIVDQAAAVPWAGVTGKPTSFAPSAHAPTHNLGGSDPITPDWTQIANRPASFVPSAHAASHLDNGADVIPVVTSTRTGLAPKLSGTATSYLDGTGAYSTPPGAGDMKKSVYDSNADNIVDHAALADTAPWTGVTGKPATFPPDATAELVAHKGAANGYPSLDGTALVPIAQLPAPSSGDAAASQLVKGNDSRLTNARSPTAHAASHLDNGSDPVPVATASRTGLLPILANTTTKFLRDDGTWQAIGGGGDMLKSTYDTNGNGVVDTADSIPWTSVTGKPTGNLVDPGAWTNLSLGAGWTAPTQAQYRIEVNGAVSTVRFRGMIQAAYSALGATAFTLPSTAFPSMTRSAVLGGAQNTGTPSDVAAFIASVSSAGVATIYFLGASAFVWADQSQIQMVYLDGLSFSL